MLTIVWNPNGFHLVDVLPGGCKFNAGYSMSKVLGRLSEWRQGQRGEALGKLKVHADNTRLSTAAVSTAFIEEYEMKKVNDTPHSQDLALSDFYLFGHVKDFLSGCSFATGNIFHRQLRTF
jgi:hypothetical protein